MTITNPTPPTLNEFQELSTEDQIRKLEGQVLHYRKLHADALQMLVSMGRILLANQQTLLNVIAEVRDKYELFSNFIVESSSQLSIVNPEAIVDPDE